MQWAGKAIALAERLGEREPDGTLRYAGRVGTGFTDAMLRALKSDLKPLEVRESPFPRPIPKPHAKDVHWVKPTLVGEVTFSETTREGRLRHPSWRGLRPDKSSDEVRRES